MRGPQEETEGERKGLTICRTITHWQESPLSRCLSGAGSSFLFSLSTVTPGKPLRTSPGALRPGDVIWEPMELIWASLHCAWAGVRPREGQGLARGHRAEGARRPVSWLPGQGSPHVLACCRGVHIHTPPLLTSPAHRQPQQSPIWASATYF